MNSRFFIGNLDRDATEDGLHDFFVAHGVPATRVSIVVDRATGLSRGFGFVELHGATEAEHAIATLAGLSIGGRALTLCRVEERDPGTWRRGR